MFFHTSSGLMFCGVFFGKGDGLRTCRGRVHPHRQTDTDARTYLRLQVQIARRHADGHLRGVRRQLLGSGAMEDAPLEVQGQQVGQAVAVEAQILERRKVHGNLWKWWYRNG